MPTEGTYGFYSKLVPNQPTTVVDKAAERENKRRALDIADQNRKAREAEVNKTNFKYEEEDWDSAQGRWSNIANTINSHYQSMAVAINDSDIPKPSKAEIIARYQQNPDNLIKVFKEFEDFGNTILDEKTKAEIPLDKYEYFKNSINKFMNGNFDVEFDDNNHTMSIVEYDADGNRKLVNIKDKYNEVQGLKEELSAIKREHSIFNDVTSEVEMNKPEKMLVYPDGNKSVVRKLGTKEDKNSLYNLYYGFFKQQYGSGATPEREKEINDKIDEQIKLMYERDSRIARPYATDDGGSGDPEKDNSKYEWKEDLLDIKADDGSGKASSGLIYNKGAKSTPIISLYGDNETSITGLPTNIEYDAAGNILSFKMLSYNKEGIDEMIKGQATDGVDLSKASSAALFTGKQMTFTSNKALAEKEGYTLLTPDNVQILNTEFKKLKDTLVAKAQQTLRY